ncbi:helicase HerA domain-containing protein [Methanococcus maripaludis]|uniref:Uncharacterized protein n=1 Tax=Methanococcus maripaludis (strain DSM 14266 / JCM 13030 / NBRC 101832 / S2 / LL) TaxID=267377 RepID=Q6LXT3_METMP|nr:ATP-binding protein [Methanococcus maripaludis]CAF30820.1 conserved hypothetical protein [Methanococcus maripaludis S2]
MDDLMGYVIGETSNTELNFLAKHMPEIGSYVSINYCDLEILGMVESVNQGCKIFEDVYNVKDFEKLKDFENNDSYYTIGKIKILGDVKNMQIPRIPPKPGTEVYDASEKILGEIFSKGTIEIGNLISADSKVKLDVNKLCSRHLAILAITGMGKSNTVSVLLEELNNIHATVLVFDMHREYVEIEAKNSTIRRNIIRPKINVYNMSYDALMSLAGVDPQATVQRAMGRRAMKKIKESKKEVDFNTVDEYINSIINELNYYMGMDEFKSKVDSILTLIMRFEDLMTFKDKITAINYNPIQDIKENYVNIVDISELDESSTDLIISYFTGEILKDRKKVLWDTKVAKPIFIIYEEAHLIVPQNRPTKSKIPISKIAREGRKFGVGICLVSQRPKTLDQESLSQCNNFIISKLIEPSDQKHVQHASENLSEDLLNQLPGLNVGEAVIIGPCLKIPAMVKIKRFEGEYGGEDVKFDELWTTEKEKNIPEFIESNELFNDDL